MKILGWIIWGLGCLLLLGSLRRLRKPRGRVFRIIFFVITATALVVTLLTPVSKFHLLWILPLRLLLGLLGFGLLAGGALTYHKLTARKPKKTLLPANTFPPFGELKWTFQVRSPTSIGRMLVKTKAGSVGADRAADS